MRTTVRWLECFTLLAMLCCAPTAAASPIRITVDTAALADTAVALAFDVVDGGPPVNSVTIASFSTNGTLGGSTSFGDVTGSFPGAVTLADTSFFSEYLQALTLGTSFAFVFETTGHAPGIGSLPDTFALFVLDPVIGLPLLSTSDPTGAAALFLFNIGEADPLTVYTASGVIVTAEIIRPMPAPSTLALAVLGFIASLSVVRRRT